MSKKFPGGVITVMEYKPSLTMLKKKEYALPAVNVVGTNSVNAVLETAAEVNSPSNDSIF